LRSAAARAFGGEADGGEDEPPPPPPPADTIARAEARRGGDLGDLARGAGAAAAQPTDGGPGMTASSTRPDDPEAE
ncbi:MAG TPA: hypothetical protein VF474_15860, partial [Phenylobacterium sp.]